MSRKIFLLVFFALDVFSKFLALRFISPLQFGDFPYGGIGIFSDFFGISFSLNTVVNTGFAWGLFAGHAELLFFLRGTIISVIVWCIRMDSRPNRFLWLVLTGAVGNALDYLLYGHVIDFFHFVFWGYSFPIFNLADSYITLGAIGLLFIPRKTKPAVTL